ncbi:MAG: hypothetical protein CMK32_03870 [Porticoccaceae bacterium]|nr:hypothetical protein [Porticoccaceae bacterium]
MDINSEAKQQEFATLVGITRQATAKHIEMGTLSPGDSYREWILAYCSRLRTEAAGRSASEHRNRRDAALAWEAEMNATMKAREIMKQDGELLDYEHVLTAMLNWTEIVKSAMARSINGVVKAIESQYGITVDRGLATKYLEQALTIISEGIEFTATPRAGSLSAPENPETNSKQEP